MFLEPVEADPIRQFSDAEEKQLTRNLLSISRNIRLTESKAEGYRISLFQTWHLRLFNGIRDHAGRFRANDYGENILNFGRHRSSPREKVIEELEAHVITAHNLFSQLVDIKNNSKPSVFAENTIRAALYLHAVFIKIHPFLDGNGRVGRLIMTYVLSRYDMPPIAFEVPKEEYIDCLNIFYNSNNINLDPLYDLVIRIYKNQL